MTKDEALKLAQIALEDTEHSNFRRRRLDALIAIKQALAQPDERPWVGLTGEDFSAIKFPVEMRFPAEFRAGARWAEAKLKEKNT